jgi:hypothetical protein
MLMINIDAIKIHIFLVECLVAVRRIFSPSLPHRLSSVRYFACSHGIVAVQKQCEGIF